MLGKHFLRLIGGSLLLFVAMVGCGAKPQAMVVTVEVAAPEVMEVIVTQEVAAVEKAASAPVGSSGSRPISAPVAQTGRMIIKNGEMELEVENTDVAIDRITQIVSDIGGYIISSQIQFKKVNESNYKYATLNLGVPSIDFEVTLRRLREIAVRVLNESASGQDVTDEYVDMDSRLQNLKATRDRIREFLDKAQTVEEALKVNDQLSEVEEEIETVQGRMNYLKDRAAYSTILVSLEPVIPAITPTLTPTPEPTVTPTPWQPGKTLESASSTLGETLRSLINASIYFGVVYLPFLVSLALLAWAGWRLRSRIRIRRRGSPPSAPPAEEQIATET